jgi:hypothetical protein
MTAASKPTKASKPASVKETKAQRLARIELETQAIEAQIAAEKGLLYTPPVRIAPAELAPAPQALDEFGPVVQTTHKVKTVKTGVGAQILQLIAEGVLTNKEIVARVLGENPMRKTTYACVAWYKSQVAAGKLDLPRAGRRAGLEEPGNVEA